MANPMTLADRDLHALMAVAEDGRHDDPGPAFPWATLDNLARLIGCNEIAFNELDPHHYSATILQSASGSERYVQGYTVDDADDIFWRYYWDFACSYPDRTGDMRARRFTDDRPMAELLSAPAYVDFYRPNGYMHSLGIALPAPPGLIRKLFLSRESGSDFSERDVLVLELLRPHLYDVFLDADRRRNGIPRLTSRELEILQLAATGNSNRDIAARLFISVSTVRKHMEHIFDHTGTRTRAGAAAAVLPHLGGLTPPTAGVRAGSGPERHQHGTDGR